jgi:hypothetical protein
LRRVVLPLKTPVRILRYFPVKVLRNLQKIVFTGLSCGFASARAKNSRDLHKNNRRDQKGTGPASELGRRKKETLAMPSPVTMPCRTLQMTAAGRLIDRRRIFEPVFSSLKPQNLARIVQGDSETFWEVHVLLRVLL